MKHLFSLILILSTLTSFSQSEFNCYHYDESGQTREHNVDFKSMLLDISFDVNEKKVVGQVHYEFSTIRPTINQIILDAPDITIEEVKLDGMPIKYGFTDEHLVLNLPVALPWEEDHTLDIKYEAQPEKGLYFLGWNDSTKRARKQIWTQGQGIDNRYWIPSFDDVSDKLLTETVITFQSDYEVISNGDLLEQKKNEDGTTTWHYKMKEAHVPYLVMIAIGEFNYLDMTSSNGIVNRQYYYPEKPQEIAPTYRHSNDMMDWMEKEFGVDYPWGKIYRNVPVADFLYGAMENTSSTIFTDYYLQDSREALERNYVGTNAHELTHQWFGDLISEWNGASHWLHESFATHYAKHFERTVYGEESFQWERYMEMTRAMSADDKNSLPIAHSKSGSSRHYPKGSFVIDMLRDAAGGDEAYQKVITNYLKKYAYKNVDTHLFQMEFMETLGLNLDWFFNQWIRKGGYPQFECKHVAIRREVLLNIKQVQEQSETIGLFKVQMPIQVRFKDGSDTTFLADLQNEEHSISIPNGGGKAIQYVLFNVNNTLYAKLTHERSISELIAQAQYANDMIDRYLALKALEDSPMKDKRAVLIERFNQESFYAPKANIVKQLANDNNGKSKLLIKKAFQDEDVQVRRAAIAQVDVISKELLPLFEARLYDSSYVNIEKVLVKLIKQFPENSEKYLESTEADAKGNDLFNITHLRLKVENGNDQSLPNLVDFAGPSFEFRTRIKAIEALTSLEYQEEDFINPLIEASVNFNRRLAGVARNSLVTLTSSLKDKYVIKQLIGERSFDKNEMKRLEVLESKLDL